TKPERILRSLLWKRGLRFRKNYSALPGRPDIVFTRARVVVFCDGDFWHGKNWAERRPRLAVGANASYWTRKIEANMIRDQQRTQALASEGWEVLRFWES